jgi:hypothetical protein
MIANALTPGHETGCSVLDRWLSPYSGFVAEGEDVAGMVGKPVVKLFLASAVYPLIGAVKPVEQLTFDPLALRWQRSTT